MAEENLNVAEVPGGAPQGAGEGTGAPPDGENIAIEEGEAAEGEKPEEEEKPPEEIHLKTKPVPAVVMLIGGAATAISCFVRKFPLLKMLFVVFIALLCFWIAGCIIKLLLDRIVIEPPEEEEKPEEEAEDGEGEANDGAVIEKNTNA
ncbi:MAG: hypothetical protein IJU93_09635 [Lachnospiraceae bacterium]|nr:hypothetical protein [Lachnospiraceae bacterium]